MVKKWSEPSSTHIRNDAESDDQLPSWESIDNRRTGHTRQREDDHDEHGGDLRDRTGKDTVVEGNRGLAFFSDGKIGEFF